MTMQTCYSNLSRRVRCIRWSPFRVWAQQFAVLQVGWTLSPLHGDARAQAQLVVCRSDGQWFPTSQADDTLGSTTSLG